jgi:uncharacterized protein YjbI with pentapeptide repeats
MAFGMRVQLKLLVIVLAFCGVSELAFAQARDFREQDLGGRSFVGQALDGADFTGGVLRGTQFNQASLKGAIFQEADLRGTSLAGADLTGADLRRAIMPFFGDDTILTQANLEGLDMKDAGLFAVVFRGANLRGTTGWGSITNCSFRGADLRGANLITAWVSGRTDGMFTGAQYDSSTRWPKWLDVETSGAKRVD